MSSTTTAMNVTLANQRDLTDTSADAAVSTTRAVMRGTATKADRYARNVLALQAAGLVGDIVPQPIEGQAKAITPQRAEVLGDLMAGLSYTEMATRQHRKVDTVKSHCANLYRIFGVSSRVECVVEAVRAGVLPTIPAEAPARATRARKATKRAAS